MGVQPSTSGSASIYSNASSVTDRDRGRDRLLQTGKADRDCDCDCDPDADTDPGVRTFCCYVRSGEVATEVMDL